MNFAGPATLLIPSENRLLRRCRPTHYTRSSKRRAGRGWAGNSTQTTRLRNAAIVVEKLKVIGLSNWRCRCRDRHLNRHIGSISRAQPEDRERARRAPAYLGRTRSPFGKGIQRRPRHGCPAREKAAAGRGIASNVLSTNAPGAMNRSWAAPGERRFVKEPYRS